MKNPGILKDNFIDLRKLSRLDESTKSFILQLYMDMMATYGNISLGSQYLDTFLFIFNSLKEYNLIVNVRDSKIDKIVDEV